MSNLRLQHWLKQEACLDSPLYRITAVLRDKQRLEALNREWNVRNPDRPRDLDCPFVVNLCRHYGGDEILWDKDDVQRNFGLLMQKNTAKYDIYVTPIDKGHHYLLIDDLTAEGKDYIKREYSPCLIHTSSEDNYQAVVKIPRVDNPKEQSYANLYLQQLNHLPRGYGGDYGISGVIHPFRIAGMNNKKPGRGDYQTKIELYRPGAICDRAIRELQEIRETAEVNPIREKQPPRDWNPGEPGPIDQTFREMWEKEHRRAKYLVDEGVYSRVDLSTIDYRVCKKLLEQGEDSDSIAGALARESPGIATRHRSDPWGYIERTVEAAEPSTTLINDGIA